MLEKYLIDTYGEFLEKLYIYENKTSIKFSTLVIKEKFRNSGIGSDLMKVIINYADNNTKAIFLSPEADYGSTIERLIKFYESFGFVKNEDSDYEETMVRYPRIKTMKEDKIKGGLADKKTINDIADKHNTSVDNIKKEITKGVKVELEHTSDKTVAYEIAKDHVWEDPKYYDKLNKMESKPIKEDVNLKVSDETPETVSVVVEYNDRNAGIITLAPSPTKKDTMEIVEIQFKKEYATIFIIAQGVKALWGVFKNINSIIVAPKIESVEFWNKLGFSRISPNYLISNRGH